MVFLARLVRILAILLLVRLVLRAFASRRRGSRRVPPAGAAGDLVRDQVCNTFVPRDRALRELVGAREEFFCSRACRDRRLAGATAAGHAP